MVASEIIQQASTAMQSWRNAIGEHLALHKLERFEIELFCLPLPSAEGFRSSFREAMGLS
jgi:hypothetical protein